MNKEIDIKSQELLDKMIYKYGFEHVNTITLAGYVENMDYGNVKRVFDMLY